MNRLASCCALLALLACCRGAASEEVHLDPAGPLGHAAPASDERIAVLGTRAVTRAHFERARRDVAAVLGRLDDRVRSALIRSGAKMIVARDEAELEERIDFYVELFPLEAVFIDPVDETLSGANGVSGTELELMYLIVYYALLDEPALAAVYSELEAAYAEARERGLFVPGEAYADGYIDEIHAHASESNALKYGSYLFGLYAIYFGDGDGRSDEFRLASREELEERNPLGFRFMAAYLDR